MTNYPYLAEELNPAFWQWVCSLRAYDNPSGDFIRDTREIRDAHDPNEDWWEVCPTYLGQGCSSAQAEYERRVKQFNRLPQQLRPDVHPTTPEWTLRLRKKLLPYCVWRHESGRMYLVNRNYEPIWYLIGKSDGWCKIDKPSRVLGHFDSKYLYNAGDLRKYGDNLLSLVAMVMNRLSEDGLPPLPSDCRDHPRATEGPVTAERLHRGCRQPNDGVKARTSRRRIPRRGVSPSG